MKVKRFSEKMSAKSKVFRKKSYIGVDWLIWSNHLSYSCELIESVHMNLVTWLNWLIYSSYTIHCDRINTFSHVATIELIDLAWVVYKSGPGPRPRQNSGKWDRWRSREESSFGTLHSAAAPAGSGLLSNYQPLCTVWLAKRLGRTKEPQTEASGPSLRLSYQPFERTEGRSSLV